MHSEEAEAEVAYEKLTSLHFFFSGCLYGWVTMPDESRCYKVGNISMVLSGKMEDYCRSIYGLIAVPRDVQSVMTFIRIVMEEFVRNWNHYDVEKEIKEIVGVDVENGLFSYGLPLCERTKSTHKVLFRTFTVIQESIRSDIFKDIENILKKKSNNTM